MREKIVFENFYDFLQNQKFTCISLVFDSVALKLYDLGQMFWASFHKLLTLHSFSMST